MKNRWMRFLRILRQSLKRLLRTKISLRFLPMRRVMAGISILGLMFLCCILGAAIMHFDFGPASVLRYSFGGIQAWQEHGKPATDSHFRLRNSIGSHLRSPGKNT